MRSGPPRLVRTYNNTVNFGLSLTGRFLIPSSPCSARDLIDSASTSTRPFPSPTNSPAVAMLHLQDRLPVLRASLNRQQFEALNNSWRSNLTTNKLDRIIRDLVRAFKPPCRPPASPPPPPRFPFATSVLIHPRATCLQISTCGIVSSVPRLICAHARVLRIFDKQPKRC